MNTFFTWIHVALTTTMITFHGTSSLFVKFPVPSGQRVIDGENAGSTRSKLECAIWCNSYINCSSFAFDAVTRVCHLHPVFSSGDGYIMDVYTNLYPLCSTESPAFSNGQALLNGSLETLSAAVICNPDFIFNETETILTCNADGQWIPIAARCVQRIWRNPMNGNFKIPRVVQTGWSACFSGVPTYETVFFTDIRSSETLVDVPIRVAWRFSNSGTTRRLVLTYYKNGFMGNLQESTNSFLLQVNSPFLLKLSAISSRDVQFIVNGLLFWNYTLNPGFTLADFLYLHTEYDVNMSVVDAWCQ